MAGSTLGTIFSMSTWGESHGTGIGVVIDGCPAGLSLDTSIIQAYLDRRKPGQTKYSTSRKESDTIQILSGIFEGKTTGTPISLMITNESQRSQDYSELSNYYRPGHADFTYDQKYGFRDYRGGGRSSGRETAARVAAGAVACEVLKTLGVEVCAYTKKIGSISVDYSRCKKENILSSPLFMPDLTASAQAEEYLSSVLQEQNSAGGIIECIINGLPSGIGDPVFQKLDACLAKAVMSIGAVKGIEFGEGFAFSEHLGSEMNDSFMCSNGKIQKYSNHAGGILGGISDGSEIIFRAVIKPTPSIAKEQKTVTTTGEPTTIQIHGRHDPVIVPRAVVVVESMAAITILDLLLSSMTARLDHIQTFFKKIRSI